MSVCEVLDEELDLAHALTVRSLEQSTKIRVIARDGLRHCRIFI